MNLLLVLTGLVVFIYFGGKYVPQILKANQQIILGCLVGVLLHQFLGDRVEGYSCKLKTAAKNTLDKRNDDDDDSVCGPQARTMGYLPNNYCAQHYGKMCTDYGPNGEPESEPLFPLKAAPPNETADAGAIRIENNKMKNCKAVWADPTGFGSDGQHICDWEGDTAAFDNCKAVGDSGYSAAVDKPDCNCIGFTDEQGNHALSWDGASENEGKWETHNGKQRCNMGGERQACTMNKEGQGAGKSSWAQANRPLSCICEGQDGSPVVGKPEFSDDRQRHRCSCDRDDCSVDD